MALTKRFYFYRLRSPVRPFGSYASATRVGSSREQAISQWLDRADPAQVGIS